MSLAIRIISSPNDESISERHKPFPEEGGDIGRALGVTMQLADSYREISAVHAIIKKCSFGYQVVDNSTNGLFVNGSSAAIGKGNKYVLADGDILDIGRYRLLISCFSPALATVLTPPDDNQLIDDPFDCEPESTLSNREIPESTQLFNDPFYEAQDLALVNTSSTVTRTPVFQTNIEDEARFAFDAELHEPEHIEQESEPNWDFEFHFNALEEVPLSNMDYQAKLAPPQLQNKRHRHDAISMLADPRKIERTNKALEIAFARLMGDISPVSMEAMFDDLVKPSFWRRKRNYWEMFTRYFNRQMDNQDWQIKLQAYFHEALRQQDNLDGDRW
ncbi:FHA domain-containing protein [Shewanella sp. VB17]|uniref:FHA domain-containing protein n=1 Tax=Shewanella sp. VB17 TaxID=2739432 RepID=UPI0015669941|nr:FHA domain-containing protein [Shewanella sp. VB17]NRD72403.1 FHA domain-containing protein [Shewanella sp. VB17]